MVFCFIQTQQLGYTFLDWSFYWLLGNDYHYNHKQKKFLSLSKDPITRVNAHIHKKNRPGDVPGRPGTSLECRSMINELLSLDKDIDYSVCWLSLGGDIVDVMNFCCDKKVKVILLHYDVGMPVLLNRARDASFVSSLKERNSDCVKRIKEYFLTVPNLSSLVATPSKARHFLSLSLNHLYHDSQVDSIEDKSLLSNKNIHMLNIRDLIKKPIPSLQGVFNFLECKINYTRVDHWLYVHDKWKDLQLPMIEFYDNLPIILSSIINGRSYSLEKFKLDIFFEAIIQHELMKKHQTRLMVDNLDQFPNNTKDLTPYLLQKKN